MSDAEFEMLSVATMPAETFSGFGLYAVRAAWQSDRVIVFRTARNDRWVVLAG